MSPPKKEVMRLTSLELENWKNFSHVEVNLQRRVFLVGPNASGKSNFLDVFRFLRDIVDVGGGFQEAVQRRGGVTAIRCLAARRYSEIGICVTFGPVDEPNRWEYELRFNQDQQRRQLITKERVSRSGEDLVLRPNSEDEKDPVRLSQTYLQQINVNQEFRQVAEFFASINYRHIVPQLIREPDRYIGPEDDPFGGDFLEQIATTNQRTKEARLKRIGEALKVAVPQLEDLELTRDDRGQPHLRGKYEHWRPQGAWQMEDQFSDGTLRLMGLLWSVLDGTGPLLLEEPELSLHPGVIRYLPQMFARLQRRNKRQLLVSTHSSDLLRDSGIGLDEVLLLIPERGGTQVKLASEFQEIHDLLAGGLTLADAVIPLTQPKDAEQLALFEGL
jgi:predicted ATPase